MNNKKLISCINSIKFLHSTQFVFKITSKPDATPDVVSDKKDLVKSLPADTAEQTDEAIKAGVDMVKVAGSKYEASKKSSKQRAQLKTDL